MPKFPPPLNWSNGPDIIFVMEKAHRNKLSAKFKKFLGEKRLVCLDIPDEFEVHGSNTCVAVEGEGLETSAPM